MHTIKNKKQKKYKCPYCDKKDTKNKLISHVEKVHNELIPEGYSAPRVVFNAINKKEHGTCIMCGKETKWNDNTWKYERLCGSKKCHDEYVKMVRSRMMKKYNKTTLLNDPEHQKKMLANRGISGKYKFTDGGVHSYCGSYEKKLLEFYDKVLGVKSSEIMSPGPTIEYTFNGKKRFWITDLYYITANLVHDVKDGGDNPNNREMPEYREKQIAKENAIAELDEYNYIRLTNNNFEQLLYILADIKEEMIDSDNYKYKIHINELTNLGSINAIPSNNIYITQSYYNGMFIQDGISFSKDLKDIYKLDKNKIVKTNPIEDDYDYAIFKTSNDFKDKLKEELENCIDNTTEINYDPNYFYKVVSGKDVLSSDQILFDDNFEEIMSIYNETLVKNNIIENTINNIDNYLRLPILETSLQIDKDKIINKYNNITILEDMNGYYALNLFNKSRTKSFETINDIPEKELDVLNKGGF